MCRKLLGILILCSLPLVARADQITGNQFVFAKVSDDGWGHISWFEGNVNKPNTGKTLSFSGNFSYLQLQINAQFFTNSDLAPTKIGPPEVDTKKVPGVLLNNATNRKIGDT